MRLFPVLYGIKADKMAIKKHLILLILVLAPFMGAKGQTVGVKTNFLYDATLTPNVGIEIGLSPRWTAEMSGSFNGWILSEGKRWKHWLVQPEVRYWFCDRFGGHFVGAHVLGGQYNFGGFDGKVKLPGWDRDLKYVGTDFGAFRDTRYQGWYAGLGVAYGYAWVLGDHWNLEAEIGAGYVYTEYDRFRCTGCGKKVAEAVPHHYVGPTKGTLSLVYVF